MDDDEFLEHYGKLGMKWGHRTSSKSKPNTVKKAAAKKEKILNSPTQLYKHRKEFSQEEIDKAMKKMKMDRDLRSLSRDELSTGSQFANTILGYGTAAVTAYGIYKSPLGQTIANSIKKTG